MLLYFTKRGSKDGMKNVIEDTCNDERLSFSRLYFKKTLAKKDTSEECYISKIKTYNTNDLGVKEYVSDKIVIANTTGYYKSSINKEGRWDIKCKKMASGKGYIVVDANYSIDRVDIISGDTFVQILINDKESMLIDKNKYIPLYFSCDRYYPPRVIIDNFKKKLKFIQLADGVDSDIFCRKFLKECERVYGKYLKGRIKNSISMDSKVRLKNKYRVEKL